MMTGKPLIQAINEDEKNFPHLGEIPFFFYDEKNKLKIDSTINFSDDLFAENPREKEHMLSYLHELEDKKVYYVDIQITECHIIFFPRSSNLKIFSRKPSDGD